MFSTQRGSRAPITSESQAPFPVIPLSCLRLKDSSSRTARNDVGAHHQPHERSSTTSKTAAKINAIHALLHPPKKFSCGTNQMFRPPRRRSASLSGSWKLRRAAKPARRPPAQHRILEHRGSAAIFQAEDQPVIAAIDRRRRRRTDQEQSPPRPPTAVVNAKPQAMPSMQHGWRVRAADAAASRPLFGPGAVGDVAEQAKMHRNIKISPHLWHPPVIQQQFPPKTGSRFQD